MEFLQELWDKVLFFALPFIAFVSSSPIMSVVVSRMLNNSINKLLDVTKVGKNGTPTQAQAFANYISEAVILKVIEGVVTRLGGGKINIDLTVMAEQKFEQMKNDLVKSVIAQLQNQAFDIKAIANAQVSQADVLSYVKFAPDSVKEKLKSSVSTLRTEEEPKEEIMTVIELPVVDLSAPKNEETKTTKNAFPQV